MKELAPPVGFGGRMAPPSLHAPVRVWFDASEVEVGTFGTVDVKLLVVEDEALIAWDLEETLIAADYTCVVAGNGAEAVRELEADAAGFRGVLTDIRIGQGPNGWEVGRRARELVPGMPIVYVSGDRAGEWASRGVPDSVMIAKPYALSQVVAVISQLINRAARSPEPEGT